MIKSHCNYCLGQRNHDVLFVKDRKYSEEVAEEYSIDFYDKYLLIQCKGCDNISLRVEHASSESDEESVSLFPPLISRRQPNWTVYLFMSDIVDSRGIQAILKEIYVALHSKSNRLALMGIRALIEQVMLSKIEDKGSFVKNLEEFNKNGFISESNRDYLKEALEAGHAVIHRAYKPSTSDVIHALNIVENIMEAIYSNSFRAGELRKNVTQREQKKK